MHEDENEDQLDLPGMISHVIPDGDEPDEVEPPKPEEMKLGDGKSVADIMNEVETLRKGLQMSEHARLAMEESIRNRPSVAPVQQPPAAPQPPWGRLYTDADFEKLAEEQGAIVAMRAMQTQNNWLAEQHFERRIQGLQHGGMSAAEQLARQKYPDEFKLFDAEIKQLVAGMPDKAYMNTMEGWDNALAYVRGQPQNITKYIAHLQSKTEKPESEGSRESSDAAIGFSPAPLRSAPSAGGGAAPQLDPYAKEIAREFIRSGIYKSEAEYARDYYSVNRK